MEDVKNRFYSFGDFHVDARRRILSKDGKNVSLTPRNFDLLLVMIENEGQILSHDDLLDKVWEGTFVEQSNLKNAVSVLRRILGERPNEGAYIRTIPRKGYSFVARVEVIPEEHSSTALIDEETVGEVVVDEILETENDQPGPSVGTSPPFFKKHLIASAGLLALAAFLLGYGVWQWKFASSPRLSVENVRITKLTTKGDLNGAVVSPDGSYFLYANLRTDGASLWVQQIATGSATRVTPRMPASFWFYTFSPDSNYIYYTVDNHPDLQQNGLFKVPLFGGSPQRIAEKGMSFLFSPDGKRVAFARNIDAETRYFIADPDFSNERPVTTFANEYRIWSMNWSPDGNALLFAVRKFVGDKTLHTVVEYPLNGGAARTIIPEMEKQITSAVWLPDLSSILICLREVNAEIRQIWQFIPSSGELRRLTNDDNSYKGLTITRDGKTIVTITENLLTSAWTAEDEKFDFKQITTGATRMASIGSTADGRIIFSSTNNSVETISIMNADGSNARAITTGNDGIRLLPRVSSGGDSLVFTSSRQGRKQIYRTDFDGRNFVQVTQSDYDVFDGKVLSDNRTVVFMGEGRDHIPTMVRQTMGAEAVPLTKENVRTWDISPDEKFLAYVGTDQATRLTKVFVISLESGWLYKTFDIQPYIILRWSRDGRSLTYDTIEGDSSEIFSQPIDGGPPKMLAKFPGEQIFSFDWSFDGKKLTIVRGKQLNDAVQIKIVEDD